MARPWPHAQGRDREALAPPDVVARLLHEAFAAELNLHVVDAVRDPQAADRRVLAKAVDAAVLAARPPQKLDRLVRLTQRWQPIETVRPRQGKRM